MIDKPIHPLHTPERVKALNLLTEGGYAAQSARQTGRSTAIALRLIAHAIENPGKTITIADHHPTKEASAYLAARMRDMILRLQLQHLHVERRPGFFTITFENRQ